MSDAVLDERTARFPRVVVLAYAAVAYVPLLLTAPGKIAADTKAYLYLDPGRFLGQVGSLWNPGVDAGTVTHQWIGYLFPLGPYYWFCHAIGLPTWIAQRLFFGTLLFAAGVGAAWMLRRLGLARTGAALAGLVYMLSPYILAYFGRTSVILLPWAALPWLVGLVDLSLRERSWRGPALIAVVVTIMAGTNASSVIFVLIGPALLLPHLVWVTREVEWRPSLRAVGRIALLVIPAQLWWMSGLWAQGRYGLPILQLTETVPTVAQTSTSAEILRSLGYWYFYGRDGLSQWTQAGTIYTQNALLLAWSFILPALALVSAAVTRWRHRIYFVALVLVGLILGIGTHPYASPSPFGTLLKVSTDTTAGFALRNTPRAVPLLTLGVAALVGVGVEALLGRLRQGDPARARRWGRVVVAAVVVITVVNLPPLWQGHLIQPDLQFPETLPTYWTDAAKALDAQHTDLRVMELPGSDFAAYRWGETQDPILPGLITRPWIGRELTAYGTPPSADLIRALDEPIQEGTFDPSTVAPIARLMSASDVLLRLDTQYERYHAPRPADLWQEMGAGDPIPGLRTPTTFGPVTDPPTDPRQPMRDEALLARPPGQDATPRLAVFPVDGARPIVRAEPTGGPLVVSGDSQGLVDAAGAGLLPDDRAILYAATLATDPGLSAQVAKDDPSLLVTDTNRRRAQRWGTIREDNGATEAPGSTPLVSDPKDARLDVFPGAGDDTRTVADYGPDVADVRATSYGNIVAYSAEARPANAIDGDPRTAWSTGGFSDVVGESLRVDYKHPVTADHIDLRQLDGNRYITRVGVKLDGEQVTTADLGPASHQDGGQRIDLGGNHTFTSLEITIEGANVSHLENYLGWSNVGISELTVPGVTAHEAIRLPDAGLSLAADGTTPLTYLFSRWRADPIEAYRQDPELSLDRLFTVPADRSFALTGQARINASTDGALVDAALGRPGLAQGYPVASGSDYLHGSLDSIPSAAIDGDPSTAWQTGFGPQEGRGFTIQNPAPVTVDHMDLTVLADGYHSVPTRLDFVLDDGRTVEVPVPAISDGTQRGATTTVPLTVPRFTSKTIGVRIGAVRPVATTEYFSQQPHDMPVGIVDLGIPGVKVGPLPAQVPSTCRSDLVTVDGRPVPVRLQGSVADARAGRPLDLAPCDGAPVELTTGQHSLTTAVGLDTGIDVDTLQLGSDPGGAAARLAATTPVPSITVDRTGTLSYRVTVDKATAPFWLVLGQSLSPGWKATVEGGPSLGAPTLIDGFANGWRVDPATTGSSFVVHLEWAPQKVVRAATWISGLWFLGVLGLLALLWWRRRRRPPAGGGAAAVPAPRLRALFARTGTSPPVRAGPGLALVAAVLVGSWFLAGPVPALLLAALTAAAIWSRAGRVALAVTPLVSIGLIVAVYVLRQVQRAYPPGVEWPAAHFPSNQLGLIAVLAVVADAAVRAGRRYLSQRATKANDDNQSSTGAAVTR